MSAIRALLHLLIQNFIGFRTVKLLKHAPTDTSTNYFVNHTPLLILSCIITLVKVSCIFYQKDHFAFVRLRIYVAFTYTI